MSVDVVNLDGKKVGSVDLSDGVFGLEPRSDLIQRVIRWQLAKRHTGQHKTKERAEISRTGAKLFKQKGTGRARHGSARPGIFRGGGKAHGSRVRSHAFNLPKKVRRLGLMHALSAKVKNGDFIALKDTASGDHKTSTITKHLKALNVKNALFLDDTVNADFAKGAKNIPNIDVLPIAGANVYDIIRRHKLVVTEAALKSLEERFA
jgi:large subunit ribosomal protein L4